MKFGTSWNAKCPSFFRQLYPKTSNYCLKNRALGLPGLQIFLLVFLVHNRQRVTQVSNSKHILSQKDTLKTLKVWFYFFFDAEQIPWVKTHCSLETTNHLKKGGILAPTQWVALRINDFHVRGGWLRGRFDWVGNEWWWVDEWYFKMAGKRIFDANMLI